MIELQHVSRHVGHFIDAFKCIQIEAFVAIMVNIGAMAPFYKIHLKHRNRTSMYKTVEI